MGSKHLLFTKRGHLIKWLATKFLFSQTKHYFCWGRLEFREKAIPSRVADPLRDLGWGSRRRMTKTNSRGSKLKESAVYKWISLSVECRDFAPSVTIDRTTSRSHEFSWRMAAANDDNSKPNGWYLSSSGIRQSHDYCTEPTYKWPKPMGHNIEAVALVPARCWALFSFYPH